MIRLLPFLLIFTIACKKKPPTPVTTDLPAVTDQVEEKKAAQVERNQAMEEMRAKFQEVHFSLDSSDLDAPSKAALEHNAAIMVKHPSIRLEVQGHADEQGTTDYNLALGGRRAQIVKKTMVVLGVGPDRIRTISFGEERPQASGHNQAAYSANRRAEFIVTDGSASVDGTL